MNLCIAIILKSKNFFENESFYKGTVQTHTRAISLLRFPEITNLYSFFYDILPVNKWHCFSSRLEGDLTDSCEKPNVCQQCVGDPWHWMNV